MPSIPSLVLRGRVARSSNRTSLPPIRVPLSANVVDCGVYVNGRRLPGRRTHTEAVRTVRELGEGFVWIGLHEPNEEQFRGIADTFGLHDLAVEDAVHAHQRPKLEHYDNVLFTVFKTVRYDGGNDSPTSASELVETGELMVFLGPDFVVTVRHGRHSGLGRVRRQLEDDPEQLLLGPAAVLHAIADHVVHSYLAVTNQVEEDLDRSFVGEGPNGALLKERAVTVWLDAPVEVLAERTGRRDTRPLLRVGDRAATLARLDEERRPNYAEADIHVRSGHGGHGDVVEAIVSALRERFAQ